MMIQKEWTIELSEWKRDFLENDRSAQSTIFLNSLMFRRLPCLLHDTGRNADAIGARPASSAKFTLSKANMVVTGLAVLADMGPDMSGSVRY
jgi:hypothetical protein